MWISNCLRAIPGCYCSSVVSMLWSIWLTQCWKQESERSCICSFRFVLFLPSSAFEVSCKGLHAYVINLNILVTTSVSQFVISHSLHISKSLSCLCYFSVGVAYSVIFVIFRRNQGSNFSHKAQPWSLFRFAECSQSKISVLVCSKYFAKYFLCSLKNLNCISSKQI